MVNIDDVLVRRMLPDIYLYIYIMYMTDRRKVYNRICHFVFGIKLLTNTIKYTLQTAQKYKSNSK